MNTDTSLLYAALDEVAALSACDFQGSNSSSVMRLLERYGESSNLARLLLDDLPSDVRTSRRSDVSDLLALWVWQTHDNGSRIRKTLETWLHECDDENKVWIALHREGVPFCEKSDVLDHVAMIFPRLREICIKAKSEL